MTGGKGEDATIREIVMSEPTAAELARKITALEVRHRDERAEYRAEMRSGFEEIKTQIAAMAMVSPELFLESQARQDAETDRNAAEIVWLRRVMLFGLASAITLAVVGAVFARMLEV